MSAPEYDLIEYERRRSVVAMRTGLQDETLRELIHAADKLAALLRSLPVQQPNRCGNCGGPLVQLTARLTIRIAHCCGPTHAMVAREYMENAVKGLASPLEGGTT